MDRLVYKIVQRLRRAEAPLSRNRHFSAFEAPEGRRALLIHREIRSLERDLLAPDAEVRIEQREGDDRVCLRIHRPSVRSMRTAFLTREELEILLRAPAVAGVLRSVPWEGPG